MRVVSLVALLSLVAQAGCGPMSAGGRAAALHQLESDYWEWKLKEFPEQATWLGDNRYNDRLTDLSVPAIEKRRTAVKEMLERVKRIDSTGLDGQDALSRELLEYELQLSVDGQRFPTEYLVLDQLDGPQLSFPQLASITPVHTPDQYGAYISRLNAYGPYLRQVQGLLIAGAATGWIQPNGPLRGVPEQIMGQLVSDPKTSNLFDPFEAFPDSIDSPTRMALADSAQAAIQAVIVPALAQLRIYLRDTYLPAGTRPIAAAALPDGKAYYEHQIRINTTLPLSADSVHNIGLAEVTRIRALMDSVMKSTGFKGTFREFLTFLRKDKQFYFTRADDLLHGYEAIARRANEQMPRLFAELPKNTFGVKAFPDYEAPSQTTARYYPGAEDGSRQGFFMVNLYKLDMRPKYEMEALTLHEAVPGHHIQITRAQEQKNLPAFRRNAGYTAFVEGWALYAESLGTEMGFYTDPYSKFGQLTYEMWRACRLVVDTGIHSKNWARQQAIDFMTDNTAKTEQDIAVEVDRYIVWPGQALAYKLGELKIKELRARAQTALGAKFDLGKFHNAVLDNGPLPLGVLERQIDRWIANQS